MATDSEKELQYVLNMWHNSQKCYFLNGEKSETEEKDSDFKISSAVGQIDQNNMKKKINPNPNPNPKTIC